ncbi:AraC family transcriptional regulator [Nocardia sp. CA-120079]|uniref:helix-turn-helix transcriptional regulator n=1 Tax=Nocardia sp. CA-120079 TaxID=3239974 RepID=UPI003D994322
MTVTPNAPPLERVAGLFKSQVCEDQMGTNADTASFSTANVPADLRVPLWEEHNRHWLLNLRCRTLSEDGLQAAFRSMRLGQVQLTELVARDHVVERAPEHIRAAPSGTINLCILLAGEAFVYHRGGTSLVSAGDAVVFNPNTPHVYGFPGRFHELVVHVNHDLYTERHGSVEISEPQIIRSSDHSAFGAHLQATVGIFRKAVTGGPAPSEFLDETALDLFDLVTRGDGHSSAGYWLPAKEYIRRNVHDPALSVQQVASAVGISERHLARVFATHATSVAQTISDERIRRARDLLLDPGRESQTIGEIAALAGFTSPSHFARAFRRAYGCSAREMRRSATTDRST